MNSTVALLPPEVALAEAFGAGPSAFCECHFRGAAPERNLWGRRALGQSYVPPKLILFHQAPLTSSVGDSLSSDFVQFCATPHSGPFIPSAACRPIVVQYFIQSAFMA